MKLTKRHAFIAGGLVLAGIVGVLVYRKFHGETKPIIMTFEWGDPVVTFPGSDPSTGVKPNRDRVADNDRMQDLIDRSNILIQGSE